MNDIKVVLGKHITDPDFIELEYVIDRPIINGGESYYEEYYTTRNLTREGVNQGRYVFTDMIEIRPYSDVKKYRLDYSQNYIGSIDPRYKVIRTLRNYNLPTVKNNRILISKSLPFCFNTETKINEYDIYNFLSNKQNILIGVKQDSTIYLYCLNRDNMSDRLVNNERFRVEINGVKYVKILPKMWIREYFIDELLNEDKSVFLFDYESRLSYYGRDDDYLSLNQEDELGDLLSLIRSYDLLDLEKV
jgi:hypothetical protein